MVNQLVFLQLAISLSACCHASATGRRGDEHYIKLPVVHSTNRDVFANVWDDKRAITTVSLANRSDVAYYAQLAIGTPPQEVFVQLDTGSFELWVNPDCSNLQGLADVRFCEAVGHYDPSSSSSAVPMTGTKTLQYGIGSALIQYVADDIGLAGTDTLLQQVQFGVALGTTESFSGILGIGYGQNITIPYKNFVDQLADQGITDTKAFSLALGGKDEQEGIIIFGGIDTGKFTGNLQKLPIVPPRQSPDGVPRYWVAMNSLSLTPPTGQKRQYDNTSLTVFLDSGATLTLLPTRLANSIAADFGIEATDANGFYPVNCSVNDLPGTLDFAFTGVTIRVPYYELVREFETTFFGTQCFLGISPSEDFIILGDTMLRSAYAVFDQANNAIHMAQYVNCGRNEVEITAEMDMSAVKGDCDMPQVQPASTTTGILPTMTVTVQGDGTGAPETETPNTSPGRLHSLSNAGYWAVWIFTLFGVGLTV